MAAASHKEFGVRMCLHHVASEKPIDNKPKAKGKKPTLSNKQIAQKYAMLYNMLQNF